MCNENEVKVTDVTSISTESKPLVELGITDPKILAAAQIVTRFYAAWPDAPKALEFNSVSEWEVAREKFLGTLLPIDQAHYLSDFEVADNHLSAFEDFFRASLPAIETFPDPSTVPHVWQYATKEKFGEAIREYKSTHTQEEILAAVQVSHEESQRRQDAGLPTALGSAVDFANVLVREPTIDDEISTLLEQIHRDRQAKSREIIASGQLHKYFPDAPRGDEYLDNIEAFEQALVEYGSKLTEDKLKLLNEVLAADTEAMLQRVTENLNKLGPDTAYSPDFGYVEHPFHNHAVSPHHIAIEVVSLNVNSKRPAILVRLFNVDTETPFYGLAIKNPADKQGETIEGLRLAMERALRASGVDKETRRQTWVKFLKDIVPDVLEDETNKLIAKTEAKNLAESKEFVADLGFGDTSEVLETAYQFCESEPESKQTFLDRVREAFTR